MPCPSLTKPYVKEQAQSCSPLEKVGDPPTGGGLGVVFEGKKAKRIKGQKEKRING